MSCLILQHFAEGVGPPKMSLRNDLGSVIETWPGFNFFFLSVMAQIFLLILVPSFFMFIMLSVIAFLSGFVGYRPKCSI